MIIFVSGTYIISQQQMYKFVISDKVYIACDTSSAPVTLYMPKITQEFMNVEFYISDGSSNAASNNITILPNGTDLINGGASIDITSNDGCCVLTTASTSDVNNDILSPQSIWIASSSQSGGGGGSYTANNGLNLAGTTFKLGGTLSQNTSINNNGFDLDIYSNTPTTSGALLDLNLNAIGTAFQSTALNGFGVRSMSFSGINLESLSYDDYTALFIRETSSVNDAIGVLKIVRNTTGTAFGGIGGSIDFWIEPRYTGTPPPGSPTEPTVRLAGLWENPGPNVASRLSRLDFYGYSGGAGNVLNASLRGDGFFSLYQYGLGTFAGTPAYSLGVDASGNVVEFVASGGTTPSAPFKSIQFNDSGAFGGSDKFILDLAPVGFPANSTFVDLSSSDNSYKGHRILSTSNGGSSLSTLFMQNGTGASAVQNAIYVFNSAWSSNSYLRNSSLYATVLTDTLPANTNPAKQLFFIASSNANSQFEWHYNTLNVLVSNSRLMSLASNGRLNLAKYGVNTFAGSPTYSLGVDASGNVVEFVGGGGGGFTTADNGLTANTATNVRLGGTLLANTTILNNGFDFIVSRSTTGGDAIRGVNTDGVGVRGQSTSQAAVVGVSSSNTGVSGVSTTGQALTGTVASTTNNDIKTILRLNNSNATPSNGIGAAIDFFVGTSFSPQVLAGKLGLLWTDVNNSTRKSKFFVSNVNDGIEENKLEVESTGELILKKYGVNTFAGTPTYLLGVNASGDVVETSVGGNANIQYILEANLLALELANNLDLNTLYVVTDTPNFMLMCKAETTGRISNTATIVDAGNGSYSGIVNYVSRDSSVATRIGSVIISDDTSSSPSNNNQFIGVMPSSWTLGNSSRRNVFHTLSSGALGSACQVNTFHQASLNNVLGNSCDGNTFYQGAGDNTLGDACTSNIFEQQAQQNVLGNACLYNKFELNANLNTLLDSCENNTFEQSSSGNILGVATGGCIGNRFYLSSGNQLGDSCSYNTFDVSSDNNTLADNCLYNAFQQQAGVNQLGISCSNNMFEQKANSNTLGDGCQYNKFQQRANTNLLGLNCSGNTFGISSSQNSIGDNCSANTFAQDTSSNVLGINSLYNTFEQGANNNTLGDDATGNTFGQLAASNVLGNLCGGNTFKAAAVSNTLLDQCNLNLFSENCQGNSIGLSGTSNTFHQGCNNNALSDSCISNIFFQDAYDNILGDSCSYNTFEQAAGFNTLGDTCSNNTFKQGVNSWVFGANLLNVTIEGTATGLNVTSPSYAFLYGNTTPSTISYDSANAQWYHQYYDTSTSAWITTNL